MGYEVQLEALEHDAKIWDATSDVLDDAASAARSIAVSTISTSVVADATGFGQVQVQARIRAAWLHVAAGEVEAAGRIARAATRHPYPPAQPELALLTGAVQLRLDSRKTRFDLVEHEGVLVVVHRAAQPL